MEFNKVVESFDSLKTLSGNGSKAKKVDIIKNFIINTPDEDLESAVIMLSGKPFALSSEKVTGISEQGVIGIIKKLSGHSEDEIVDSYKKTGYLSATTEEFLSKKKQSTLIVEDSVVTVKDVADLFNKLNDTSGNGTISVKQGIVIDILDKAGPKAGGYIIGILLEKNPVGAKESFIEDAIADAYNINDKIVKAMNMTKGNIGKVALMARKGNIDTNINLFVPVKPMLADLGSGLEYVLGQFQGEIEWDQKYDGMRIHAHKQEEHVRLFSRNLQEVTDAMPDVVEYIKKAYAGHDVIVDGEAIGYNKENGRVLPFKITSTRFNSKKNVAEKMAKVPLKVFAFDILYLDGASLTKKPLKERRNTLSQITITGNNVELSKALFSRDIVDIRKFYDESIELGNEGIVAKDQNAEYEYGGRHNMIKVKSKLDPLDVVVIGAEHGHGKKKDWFTSFVIAVQDGSEFVPIGNVASGFEDEELDIMKEKVDSLIISENGRDVTVKPKIILTVAYEEITLVEGKYALRFPRLIEIRNDKDEADTKAKVGVIYNDQKRVDTRN